MFLCAISPGTVQHPVYGGDSIYDGYDAELYSEVTDRTDMAPKLLILTVIMDSDS